MNTSINYATLLCNLAPIYRILSVYDVVKSEDDAREKVVKSEVSEWCAEGHIGDDFKSWTNSECESVS